MARDRQRGKRRRRSSGDAGGASARDGDRLEGGAGRVGGVDDVRDEPATSGTTPTPDPLKNYSAFVDEAKLAEAGVDVPAPGTDDDEDTDRYDGSTAAPVGERKQPVAVRSISFVQGSAAELKRVRWPDRRQTAQGTAVTLGFVVLAGGFLGLMDFIWKPIVEAII